MKKENHLNDIKRDFTAMLLEKMNLVVVRTNVKHKIDEQNDVIKFTVLINDDNKFIYLQVNRYDKKTIQISTDISSEFLQSLSTQLLSPNTDKIMDVFNNKILNFGKKYNLIALSTYNDSLTDQPTLGLLRSFSSHSYFYGLRMYARHFINSKLYAIQSDIIMFSKRTMFYYNNNEFIAYPHIRGKLGNIEHHFHLYSLQNTNKSVESYLDKIKEIILPVIKHRFETLLGISDEQFSVLDNEEFENNLTVLSMHQI